MIDLLHSDDMYGLFGTIRVDQVLQKYQNLMMTSKHFSAKQINVRQIVYVVNMSTKIVGNKLMAKVVLDGGVEKYVWYFIFRWVKSSDANAFGTINAV